MFETDLLSYILYFLQVRVFRGHANEKNFVGLTVNSEYLACGSETNEVFAYHKVSDVRSKTLLHIWLVRPGSIIVDKSGVFVGYIETSSVA